MRKDAVELWAKIDIRLVVSSYGPIIPRIVGPKDDDN